MDIDVKNQLVSRTGELIIFADANPGNSIKNISKVLDIDYNFATKIVRRCEEAGLLKTEIVSREKQVQSTRKGVEVANSLSKIKEALKIE